LSLSSEYGVVMSFELPLSSVFKNYSSTISGK